MKTVEYKVIPVSRYAITRYVTESRDDGRMGSASSQKLGEFDNAGFAVDVAEALANNEAGAVSNLAELQPKMPPAIPQHFAIVQRGSEIETRAFFAETQEDAERWKAEAEQKYSTEFRIFSRPR